MSKTREKHVHQYIKIRDDRVELWRCAAYYCNFSLYKKQEIMLEGRVSVCWGCGKDFKMSREAMQADLPMCGDCRPKDEVELTIEQFIENREANAHNK